MQAQAWVLGGLLSVTLGSLVYLNWRLDHLHAHFDRLIDHLDSTIEG